MDGALIATIVVPVVLVGAAIAHRGPERSLRRRRRTGKCAVQDQGRPGRPRPARRGHHLTVDRQDQRCDRRRHWEGEHRGPSGRGKPDDAHLGQHGQASVTSVSGLGSLGKTALPLGYRSGRR